MSNSGWTPPPPEPDRNPTDEIGKRYAEAGGGLFAAMRAIAIKDHKRMLDMNAQRLCEDHRIQQMAAGFRDPKDGIECTKGEEEDMGDSFNISGDHYSYDVPTLTQKQSAWLKPVTAALIGMAIPAAGFLGYLLANQPETKPADTNTDTVSTVRIVE